MGTIEIGVQTMNVSRTIAAVVGLGVFLCASPSTARTYDWTFTYQYPGQDFHGPAEPFGVLGSGTLTTADTFAVGIDGYGGSRADFYTLTGISGTFAGATITGLAPDGSSQSGSGLVADNRLAVEKQGFVVAPSGSLILNLDRAFDGGTQLALSGDSGFFFGAFVDTIVSNEYQGSFTLSPVPGYVPEPGVWAELLAGLATAGGAMRGRRRPAATVTA